MEDGPEFPALDQGAVGVVDLADEDVDRAQFRQFRVLDCAGIQPVVDDFQRRILRNGVGFDRLARMLDEASSFAAPTYPPYNIERLSDDEYRITKAEEFDASVLPGVFERPKGGSDAFNWQSAVIWRYRDNAQVHASISDRGRFPTFFELYSTRFGTATPNPDLGPERATNFEIGWETTIARDARIGGAVFYNDVEDLIQTVVLPATTTQAQNVGNGRFAGVEVSFDAPISDRFHLGGNFTHMGLDIEDGRIRTVRSLVNPDKLANALVAAE